ncbi:MAG: ArnT family glycosyltransferase [Xenococcaceae cyanobacterium]
MESIINLLFLLLIVVATAGAGFQILTWMKITSLRIAERMVLSISLALVLTMYIILALSAIGILYTWTAYLWLGILLAIGWKQIQFAMVNIFQFSAWLWGFWKSQDYLTRASFIFSTIFFGVYLIGALAPPSEIDALIYHLTLPKLWIKNHGLAIDPSNFSSYLPHAVHQLFTWAMLLHGDILATLLSVLAAILSAGIIYCFTRRYIGNRAAALSLLVFVSIPHIYHSAHTPLSDSGLFLYTLLTFYMVGQYLKTKKVVYLTLAAVFAGVTSGIKFNGLIVILVATILIGVVLWQQRFDRQGVHAFKPVLMFAFIAGLCALPWYMRTWVATGNPVFPVAYELLGGPPEWNESLNAALEEIDANNHHQLGHNLMDLIVSPWKLTMEWLRVGAALPFGPAFLMFMPFLIVTPKTRQNTIIWYLLSVASLFYLFLFSVMQWARWFLPAFALLAIPVGAILAELLEDRRRILRWIAVLGIAFHVLSGLGIDILHVRKYVPVALGQESKDVFLSQNTWYYDAFQDINRNFPNSKIFLMAWYSAYYLDQPYVVGLADRQGVVSYSEMETGEDLIKRLHELNITHVLLESDLSFSDNPKASMVGSLKHQAGMLFTQIADCCLKPVKSYSETRYRYRTTKTNPYVAKIELYEVVYPN